MQIPRTFHGIFGSGQFLRKKELLIIMKIQEKSKEIPGAGVVGIFCVFYLLYLCVFIGLCVYLFYLLNISLFVVTIFHHSLLSLSYLPMSALQMLHCYMSAYIAALQMFCQNQHEHFEAPQHIQRAFA